MHIPEGERAAFCTNLVTNARAHLAAAKATRSNPASGHISLGHLVDCLENLAIAGIVHSGGSPPDPEKTRGVHRVRHEQFEALYQHHLPAEWRRLQIMLKRRNADRYVEPGVVVPWQMDHCSPGEVSKAIGLVDQFMVLMEGVLAVPYRPPRK